MPVGSFDANAFGLHDMLGNVYEWLQDCWHSNYRNAPSNGSAWEERSNSNRRVLRGGSWFYVPKFVRSASRNGGTPGYRYNDIGFRIAQDLH